LTEANTHGVAITPESKIVAKRNGPRTMLPGTWIGRGLRLEYLDAYGGGQETSGVLLDWCPVGPVLNIRGARTLISWDRVCLLELVEG